MRFMMLMIPNIAEEGSWEPEPEGMAAMINYNDELEKAGILLACDGLTEQSTGFRISFAGGKNRVTDGPFSEAKEVIGGYWIIDVKSRDEAVEWARRVPLGGEGPVVEVRKIQEMGDFSPELMAAAEALR